jgi:hypothetical protein
VKTVHVLTDLFLIILGLAAAVIGIILVRDRASLRELTLDLHLGPIALATSALREGLSHSTAQRIEFGVGLLGIAVSLVAGWRLLHLILATAWAGHVRRHSALQFAVIAVAGLGLLTLLCPQVIRSARQASVKSPLIFTVLTQTKNHLTTTLTVIGARLSPTTDTIDTPVNAKTKRQCSPNG